MRIDQDKLLMKSGKLDIDEALQWRFDNLQSVLKALLDVVRIIENHSSGFQWKVTSWIRDGGPKATHKTGFALDIAPDLTTGYAVAEKMNPFLNFRDQPYKTFTSKKFIAELQALADGWLRNNFSYMPFISIESDHIHISLASRKNFPKPLVKRWLFERSVPTYVNEKEQYHHAYTHFLEQQKVGIPASEFSHIRRLII